MRSEEDKVYLANKHKGGEANVKGGLYEDYYAVYQMVACIAKYKRELDGVAFQTQLEDTFVDDLLIVHPEINVYHQLKNTQQLSWNTKPNGSRTVASDFEKQIEDCEDKDETFALKLVYSAIGSNVATNVPENISKYTTAEFFPYQDDLNSLILISTEFKDVLRQISARGNDSSDDELSEIATVFLGVWRANGGKEKLRLSEIVEKAERVKHFNLAIHPSEEMSEDCRGILEGIDGLEFYLKGRMLYWSIGLMSGSYPWSVEVQERIVMQRPKTKREFISLF